MGGGEMVYMAGGDWILVQIIHVRIGFEIQ